MAEPMALDDSFEDVEEELHCLQPGLPQEDVDEAADLVRALFSVGASPVEAKAVLVEVFSPPRVTARASQFPRFGVLPGGAFDLRPGPDGREWDFDRAEDRAEAERRIDQSAPYLLIGSPPCTEWSSFNIRLNHKRMDPQEVERRRRRARTSPKTGVCGPSATWSPVRR